MNQLPRLFRRRWSHSMLGLTLASAACLSHAQSTVQVYGTIDLGISSQKLSGQQRTTQVLDGSLTTSYFGIRGTEDVGGGWSTQFALESFFRADTGVVGRGPGDPLWGRAAFVGLSGPVGTVRLGRLATPTSILALRTNPLGANGPLAMHTYLPSVTQPMITASGGTDAFWSNAVAYVTPDMSGFSASFMAAPGEGTTNGRRRSASVNYASGPLLAGLATEKISGMSLSWGAPAPSFVTVARPLYVATNASTSEAGLSYDLQWLKLFATASNTKVNDAAASNLKLATTQLGATTPVGRGNVILTWAHTTKKQTALDNISRDTVAAGYDYWLSKRTDVYLLLMHDKVSVLNTGNSLTLGLRHAF